MTVGRIGCAFVSLDNGLHICFIYCPPKNCTVTNCMTLFVYLQHKIICREKLILMSDFNEDVLKQKQSDYIYMYHSKLLSAIE